MIGFRCFDPVTMFCPSVKITFTFNLYSGFFADMLLVLGYSEENSIGFILRWFIVPITFDIYDNSKGKNY